jgi:type II secretory pathway component PulM
MKLNVSLKNRWMAAPPRARLILLAVTTLLAAIGAGVTLLNDSEVHAVLYQAF